MAIQDDLNQQLKAAMRAKDKQTLNLIRMLKSKMTEKTTASGFAGEVDDTLWLGVITSYAKSQKKALVTYEGAEGESAQAHAEQLRWELNALEQWLPSKADEATVRAWVEEAIAGCGGRENAHIGRVMGAVMKAHKSEVDPGMVRQIAEGILNP
ncbi:MAG: GatB/YqeY domain-containing protein [Myxococcota bacterium]|nr:GatB/YqeY domain-containing protein [Myxococcota bacterium]